MASEEASSWRTRAGDAGDNGSLITSNTGGGAGGDAATDADTVARMSKKRQRMEQLIKKSMGMVPRTFEHEALSTRGQQHTGSATPASSVLAAYSTSDAGDGGAVGRAAADADGDHSDDSHKEEPRLGKHCWTPEEDAKLCALVQQHGCSQWAKVAAHFPHRDRKRCRERFVNHLDPQLKQQQLHDKWTAQEEAQLVELQRTVGNKWATIARRLPGRSPEDVKNRFLARAAKQQLAARSQSPQTAESEPARVEPSRAPPKRWSKAEANALRSLVQAHGATNWFFLASHLPGRTDLQCMQQWYQVLDPAVIKGRGTWTAAEDATLLVKVLELGPKWTQLTTRLIPYVNQISRSLPGRVGKQCRERYLNHLDPSLSKDPWTPEEDAKLTQACEKHATQWFLIAKELPGRSENAIKNHWHALVRRNVLQATTMTTSSTSNARNPKTG